MTTGDKDKRARVLSGMRPTGRLHIGHYFGALQNWVRLQNDPAFECFYFIADWHALTSDYADSLSIAENTVQIMIDYLAAGLDPQKSVIFQQSLVPEHAELHLLLAMVTPLGRLERVPTYKEALDNIRDKDLHTYGFLGYPTLQTADIVMYSNPRAALYVPVGEDQASHVELSREIVRRFQGHFELRVKNALFSQTSRSDLDKVIEFLGTKGTGLTFSIRDYVDSPTEFRSRTRSAIRQVAAQMGTENFLDALGDLRRYFVRKRVLAEPAVMLTQTPRIPGTDGRKMSKSYNNAIMLSESDESIWAKVRPMKTDPARIRRTDKGDPDKCPVYDWHKLFSTKETLDWAAHGCRTAEIGCIDCKKKMVEHLIQWITPVRERRLRYEANQGQVREIIQDGSVEARKVAQRTMRSVRDAVFGSDRILRKTLRVLPEKRREAGSES